jgi:phosphoglycerol transferase
LNPRIQHFWGLLPLTLALFAASSLSEVLPQIMHDEYIYSSQARNLPFEEHSFSNYLFSWVMGFTKFCSTDFYSCAKFINTVMFAVGVLFTLLIAARLLSFGWAIFVASVTALSPLVIQTSFFMPETMYFMAMTIAMWSAIFAASKNRLWLWSIAGLILGSAALVKPHAIFLVPAFMVYASLVDLRKTNSGLFKALPAGMSVLFGFLISKLGIGFLFAGTEGLRLFGGYGSPVDKIAQVAGEQIDPVAGESSALEVLITVATSHLIAHIAVMALLAGLPLILALRVLVRVLRTKEEIGQASSFLVLIALVTISLLALVPTFEAYVTASGDDHSLRLILRYYEFLIPSYLIAAFLMDRFVEPGKASRWIQAGLVASLGLIFAVLYPQLIDTKFADSSFLAGLEDVPILFIAAAVLNGISALYWAFNPDRGAMLLSRAVIPTVLLLSTLLSHNLLVTSSSTLAFFDVAGQKAGQVLRNVPGDEIAVVGQVRTHIFTAMFWIDKAEISEIYEADGQTLDVTSLEEKKYYLVLGNLALSGDFKELATGDRFQVIERIDP